MNVRLVLALAAVAALLGFGIERLIVTDAEAITSALEGAADAVTRRDWDALARTIDDGYSERGRDKAAFVAFVRATYENRSPMGVGVDVSDTTVDGDRAATRIVVKPGAPYGGIRIPGRVDLVRTSDGWKIANVAADEIRLLAR